MKNFFVKITLVPKVPYFFFPEKFRPHSLTRFQRVGKKKQRWKKKNTIFTHSLEKPQKGANFNLFRVKKKYGTFGPVYLPLRRGAKREFILGKDYFGLTFAQNRVRE